MRNIRSCLARLILRCTLCGQEIGWGEDYWYYNGSCVCQECFLDFARAELASYRYTRGEEEDER